MTNRTSPWSRSFDCLAVDVEPVLRTICRSEVTRRVVQRSTSKFLHYLQRDREPELRVFGAERSSKAELEFLNDSCSVFAAKESG